MLTAAQACPLPQATSATLTPAKLATRLGFTWPLRDDFLKISNPKIVYTSVKGYQLWGERWASW